MLNFTYSVLATGIFFVFLFFYTRIRFAGVGGLLTKTIASLFFILTALSATLTNLNSFPYSLLLLAGLLFSLLGDIFLDLKSVYPQDRDLYLYSGMTFFSLAHVFYVAVITLAAKFSFPVLLLLLATAAAASFSVIASEKLVGLEIGKFKIPSFVYGTFLTATLLAALYWGFTNTDGFVLPLRLLAVGGFFFLLSDLLLSQIYFKKGNQDKENNPAWLVILNHATYYAAQFLIAMSIAFW